MQDLAFPFQCVSLQCFLIRLRCCVLAPSCAHLPRLKNGILHSRHWASARPSHLLNQSIPLGISVAVFAEVCCVTEEFDISAVVLVPYPG